MILNRSALAQYVSVYTYSRRLSIQGMHYYVIDVITQAYIVLGCPTQRLFRLIRKATSCVLMFLGGGHIKYSTQSEQIRRCRTNKPTPLKSNDLRTAWVAMEWLNTRCPVAHVLRGSIIGYLATLVPVGSMHRLYMYFIKKKLIIINNNYKLNWDS